VPIHHTDMLISCVVPPIADEVRHVGHFQRADFRVRCRRLKLTALPAASFADPSLTRIIDPDKLFGLADGAPERSHARVAAHRTEVIPSDVSVTVTNLQVHVFATFVLAGSIGASGAQDAALGEKVFLKCKACHQIGEGAKDAVGPVLNGIVGRPAKASPPVSIAGTTA
jgi:hypothetical protein